MGEASPTKVRGDAMDDVIFSGTQLRPARNMAEVTLALANPDRDAPAAWNDLDEIQIGRRIERGSGSAFLINGQDSRARDVRNFFADIASGTASSALVNQGQIADLIRHKPANRRHVLEEAAGITGLQSRRHEAELRLQGADRNLEQLLTVIENLESQHASLKRQERQAQRYRNLGRRIRDAEERWRLRLWQDAATIPCCSARRSWLHRGRGERSHPPRGRGHPPSGRGRRDGAPGAPRPCGSRQGASRDRGGPQRPRSGATAHRRPVAGNEGEAAAARSRS